MKKSIPILLLLLMLFVSGCGGSQEQPAGNGKTTLMVYMIGSDLEAKAGAGTKDLTEMENSGVDLSKVNVLVYAGGSANWHNELADEQSHTVLQLTDSGFVPVSSVPGSSMGAPECLAGFLHFGWQYYPADQFALILWDHGDGPVIGYGKDMLWDNDCLTLEEMRTALDASPFGEDNRLAWVGFDACLMASAELSCLWAPYADYLLASQEVEPSFGWNYDFLSGLGTLETKELLEQGAQLYLQTCEEYYADRGYEHRDTTLSCVDLSVAAELESALEALFTEATGDVAQRYDELTARRVSTRALGRASTGSEYDLIDLADLARQLGDVYPDAAQKLQSVLERMVLVNASNARNCCGMSMYYPFYNKDNYETQWAEAYGQLGLFPAYQSYLQEYQKIWLQSDMLTDCASSALPTMTAANTYTLQLTDQQAAHYADSRYYILRREGTELYTMLFSSADVTNEDGLLTANFDGNVIYAQNKFGETILPVTREHDAVDGMARYSVYVNLSNEISAYVEQPEGYEFTVEGYRFHLAVEPESAQICVSALLPAQLTDERAIVSGKAEEVSLEKWTTYAFPVQRHRYLTRYENGTVCPLDSWPTADAVSVNTMRVDDGLEFVWKSLAAGEYYLLFEVEDTQGSRYCSELLPIRLENEPVEETAQEPVQIQWNSPDRIKLTEQSGVSVYLKAAEQWGQPAYVFEVENRSAYPIIFRAKDLICNGTIACPDAYLGLFAVEPGQTAVSPSVISFGDAGDAGALEKINAMQFSIHIENGYTRSTVVKDLSVLVQMSGETALEVQAGEPIEEAYLDAYAGQQVLWDEAGIKVTLLDLGQEPVFDQLGGTLLVRNDSGKAITLLVQGAELDGVYVPMSGSVLTVPDGCEAYQRFSALNEDVANCGIGSIGSVRLLLRFMDTFTIVGGFSDLAWCPVALEQAGTGAVQFPESRQILMEENGVRIGLAACTRQGGVITWYLTVDNATGEDISLEMVDVSINGENLARGEYAGQRLSDCRLGAGQRCISQLTYRESYGELSQLSLRLRVLDFTGESLLFTGTQTVTLKTEN